MRTLSCIAVTLASWAAATAHGASLTGIGVLPGGGQTSHSVAFAVSADGTTVVGDSGVGGHAQPVLWRAAEGLIGLGHDEIVDGRAYGVSADGSVIVGQHDVEGRHRGFRWTEENGFQDVGMVSAHGVSADGSVVVGSGGGGAPDDSTAVRWTLADGPVEITTSNATGVSGDGQTVVGYRGQAESLQAWVWTRETGPIDIQNGIANAISADGSTVVGLTFGRERSRAFSWRAAEGIRLIGGEFSEAYAVSADGSVIVGREGPSSSETEAFMSISPGSNWNVKEVARCQGANVQGWYLREARSVSADGLTIVGGGISPEGISMGWVARLDPVLKHGDTNGDGVVDLVDLNNVRNNFGEYAPAILGDTDSNCDVGLEDLNDVRNNFGTTVIGVQAVPEPASLVLLAASLLICTPRSLSQKLRVGG